MYIWAIHEPYAAEAIAKLHALQFKAAEVDDAARAGLPVMKIGKTAMVRTSGAIIKNAGWLQRYGYAGVRETQSALKAAERDSDVESIVWVMDTPGGSVDGLQELADTVKSVASVKPVIVQVDGLLASAGYYVAANATKIYAAHDNLIGSIGVRTYMIDSSKAYEESGYRVIPIDTGEFKSAGLPGTVVTEAHIAETQRIVDGLFDSFVSVVATGRGMSTANVRAVGDGRVFFAQESVGLGLIDGVQTLEKTVGDLNKNSSNLMGRSTRTARAKLAGILV